MIGKRRELFCAYASALLMILFCAGVASGQENVPRVNLWKLPAGAIQPQAAVDSHGSVHIVYFQGDDKAGNLYYIRRAAGQLRASLPIRVNSEPNTAFAVGTVRVANIAIGEGDSVHITWNGLGPAGSSGYPENYAAYTRMTESGGGFEPQRNLCTWALGLDGGGSVAADTHGNVYVVWHASAGASNAAGRGVFVAHSADNGKTFAKEVRANPARSGACGCCGLRAVTDKAGDLYVLYRAAKANVDRDSMLLLSKDDGSTFSEHVMGRWHINACPMSTFALASGSDQLGAVDEIEGHLFYHSIIPGTTQTAAISKSLGDSAKHPTVAANRKGDYLVAWTEGTGWQKGGVLVWQVFNNSGRPIGIQGRTAGIPVWGLPAAFTDANGNFEIVY